MPCTRCGGRPTFLTEREYEGRRDRREIKLETSNISPLGAVAILRAISIRDVVIENERALSFCLSRALDLEKRERTSIFFFFRFFPSFNNSSRRSRPRARALKIKAVIIEFPFPRRADYFCHIAPGEEKGRVVERIDIISCTFNWSVYEKCKNCSMTTRVFVNITHWHKITFAFVHISQSWLSNKK